MFKYVFKKPTVKEFNFLRLKSGWSLKDKNISSKRAKDSLNSSPYCICAYDKKKIIGMIRLSGDKSMYGYIQDTMVLPDYQYKGVGTNLLRLLLSKLINKEGYLIGLCPSKVSFKLYSKFGFKFRGKKEDNGPLPFMYLEIKKDNLRKFIN